MYSYIIFLLTEGTTRILSYSHWKFQPQNFSLSIAIRVALSNTM